MLSLVNALLYVNRSSTKNAGKNRPPSPIPDGVEVIEISDSGEEEDFRHYYSFDDGNDTIESTGPFTVRNLEGSVNFTFIKELIIYCISNQINNINILNNSMKNF